MKINLDIDYTDISSVKNILKEINTAMKVNGLKKTIMCQKIGIDKATFSQFIAGKKYFVSEERIRKIGEYINKRDID